MKPVKKIANFIRAAYKHFMASDGLIRAAELAFTSLLSVVPLMILSVGIFSAFPGFKPYARIFHNFIFQHLVPASARAIQDYIELFAKHAGKLSVAGLLMAFITAILLIFSIESAFNKIWKVQRSRPGLSAFLKYWAILTLLPPLAAAAFALSMSFFTLPIISNIINSLQNFTPILYLTPVIIIFLILLFLYKTLPNCEVRFRDAAFGAIIVAPLFEIVKLSFGIYINYVSSYMLIYKAAAVFPIFLIWLFVLWIVVLIGAVFAYMLSKNPSF